MNDTCWRSRRRRRRFALWRVERFYFVTLHTVSDCVYIYKRVDRKNVQAMAAKSSVKYRER